MNISKEYFDKALKRLSSKDDLKKLATKEELKPLATKADLQKFVTKADLDDRFEHQTRLLMAYTEAQVEKLAQMVADGFEEVKAKLDVGERVKRLEADVRKIKEALHV